MSERDPFPVFLARMAAAGFTPSSLRGQNFLLDPTLHRWLCEQAGPGPGDTVVEIGVGLGFLTRELARAAGRVVGVEIEPRLLDIARDELRDYANVEWVLADALGGEGRTLHPAIGMALAEAAAAGGQGLVVANLPYSVSGPLLAELTCVPVLAERAVLLVQKEMAQRVAAAVGSPDYGSLAAAVQSVFRTRLVRDVGPQVFRPRPKVVSAVLALARRHDADPALATAADRRSFGRFVRQLFQQRRKALRSTLPAAAAVVGGQAPGVEFDGYGRRAEELGPDQLVALWRQCVGS